MLAQGGVAPVEWARTSDPVSTAGTCCVRSTLTATLRLVRCPRPPCVQLAAVGSWPMCCTTDSITHVGVTPRSLALGRGPTRALPATLPLRWRPRCRRSTWRSCSPTAPSRHPRSLSRQTLALGLVPALALELALQRRRSSRRWRTLSRRRRPTRPTKGTGGVHELCAPTLPVVVEAGAVASGARAARAARARRVARARAAAVDGRRKVATPAPPCSVRMSARWSGAAWRASMLPLRRSSVLRL